MLADPKTLSDKEKTVVQTLQYNSAEVWSLKVYREPFGLVAAWWSRRKDAWRYLVVVDGPPNVETLWPQWSEWKKALNHERISEMIADGCHPAMAYDKVINNPHLFETFDLRQL